MLPEFTKQLFQLPLISTTWTLVQSRYIQEKKRSLLPIRLILSMIEQTLSIAHRILLLPLCNILYVYVTRLDSYLCSHIDTFRCRFPIVNLTFTEVLQRYSDSFLFSFMSKHFKSSSTMNSNLNDVTYDDEQNQFNITTRFFAMLTNILMTVEIYSKCIKNELNDQISRSRRLWKKLNVEDGRSLDEVDLFSEKLLVIGRRITGNYRQIIYLARYQLKRFRSLLYSLLRFESRFRSSLWRITRRVKIIRYFRTGTQNRLVISKERIQQRLEIIMLCATKHPWIRFIFTSEPQSSAPIQSKFEKPSKLNRPMFFLPSNNTSDCSECDENNCDELIRTFQSTPYRKNMKYTKIIQSNRENEDVLSNISSSLSSTPEESFDMKEIIRQVSAQCNQSSNSSSSADFEHVNQVIEQAFDETFGDQQEQQSISVLDLSPTLASGCTV